MARFIFVANLRSVAEYGEGLPESSATGASSTGSGLGFVGSGILSLSKDGVSPLLLRISSSNCISSGPFVPRGDLLFVEIGMRHGKVLLNGFQLNIDQVEKESR
jgi:hypothetical protein